MHRKRNGTVARHISTEVESGEEKAVVITNGRRPTLDEEPSAAAPITLGNTDMPDLPITTSIPRPFQQPVVDQSPEIVPARLLQQVAPKYPPRWTGAGDVKLTASIDEHGNVFDVKSEGAPNALLSAAAEAAVYKWRYTPATVNGKPVKSETRITIRFKKEL
jgi:protein TonB